MNFFSFLYNAIFRPIGCLITLVLLIVFGVIAQTCEGISGVFTDNYNENYREYIKEGEYDKAYEYAQEHHLDITEVLSQQTYDYLVTGKVHDARNLCSKENQMYVFFHTLASNIQTIYDKKGIEVVCMAFSMIPYPSPNAYSLSDEFKKQWGLEDNQYYSSDQIVGENNRAIESLCTYLKAKGIIGECSLILEYLQPSCGEHGPDYKEVERIKKKFR